jgi:hypothetical protein
VWLVQPRLDELHWNSTLGGYFDVGLHSEDGSIQEMVSRRPEPSACQACNYPQTSVRTRSKVLYGSVSEDRWLNEANGG